mmetsp:Transcript_28331/g.47015  ORF Transcript_28331/g.47015 Transcript_28331/m.47015 type:complete len:330 (+) Transcript_28331:124-1113(+)
MHRAITSSIAKNGSFTSSRSTHFSRSLTRLRLSQVPASRHFVNRRRSHGSSTLACAYPKGAPAANVKTKPKLSWQQVQSILLSAAVPMIGFGFMDNFIMIQAGSMIDNTLGVQLGLATMTAAALGQVVSDTCGVIFGSTMERVFAIRPVKLSAAQQSLAVVPRLRLAGAVMGVIIGCSIGAVVGLTIGAPTEREEDNTDTGRSFLRLQRVMEDMMTNHEDKWYSRDSECTLYVNAACNINFPRNSATTATVTSLSEEADSMATQCAEDIQVVVLGNIIYIPVVAKTGNVLGVLKLTQRNDASFSNLDIEDAKLVACNLGIFMTHMIMDS